MENHNNENKVTSDIEKYLTKIDSDNLAENDFENNPDIFSLDDQKRAKNDRYLQDTQQRRSLARWVTWVVGIWLAGVLLTMFALGFNFLGFSLSDATAMMLLGTTTVNVLGLAYIVLKGLFK